MLAYVIALALVLVPVLSVVLVVDSTVRTRRTMQKIEKMKV